MGIGKVLGHAVAFQQFQPQVAVPVQHIVGKRCGATASQFDLVQAQPFEHLLLDHLVQQRNLQQLFQLLLGQLLKNAVLELHPQAGD